ncbi:methyltransferase [Mycobacterium vicinigordonae]|uniref:Hydroxyneurosporene methyltransferase n=1 Tax=Mycobacterium vicinigordonae TaxID=1719132 RepID=A0A7D6HRB1_9MYCO|nr:methyltransferase [Mycobacterium vicinigordonae]QLL05492.1 hydroxyneurosporene methyltransferase [Mycobacterium vicinigordonae]
MPMSALTATFRRQTPPAKVVRAVDAFRYQVDRFHRALAPPQAVIIDLLMGAWTAQAITAAADLGIADALAKGPLSAEELAIEVNADADALSRLLRALITRGVFRQRRDGCYDLTPLAATLRLDAEVSLAAEARWVGSAQHREHWSHLTDAVRTGRAVVPTLRGKSIFDYLADEPELADIFNQAMTGVSELSIAPVIAAYDFDAFRTVVDVGGGHGRLLAGVLTTAPGTRGVLFDLPHVIAGAAVTLRRHHVDDRVSVEAGSFFDNVPDGGDAYVLKHIIHDWPDDEAVQILRNVRRAAGVGKNVLLVEFVIPEHNREHLAKWADLEMLICSSARERTAAQYDRLLKEAGLQMNRVIETASPFSIVEATVAST